MKTLLASGRCKVDVSVLPVFRPEGYMNLPLALREFLGGTTHAEHVKHVDNLISEDVRSAKLSPLGLFSASELFEEAAAAGLTEPTLETLTQVVSQEVLGAGTFLEYESASSLLAAEAFPTFEDAPSDDDAAVDEIFFDAFEDLKTTFTENEIDELHRQGLNTLLTALAEVPLPALVTLSGKWADHALEASGILEETSDGPRIKAEPELSVILALVKLPTAEVNADAVSLETAFSNRYALKR